MSKERNITGVFDEYGNSSQHYNEDINQLREIESEKVRTEIGKIGLTGILVMAVSAGLMLGGVVSGLLGSELTELTHVALWGLGGAAAIYGGVNILRKVFGKSLDLPSLSVMRKSVIQQQEHRTANIGGYEQSRQQTNVSYPQQNPRSKQLMRSRSNRVIAGVAGGLGEYFNVSPALIRFAFIIANFATGGTALFAYIIMAMILPKNYDDWRKKR